MTSESDTLMLNLKREYFEQIKAGIKKREYREYTYWAPRILPRVPYLKFVRICMGYPRLDETEKILLFPWNGYEIEEISHPVYENHTVKVISIITEGRIS
jgi:hypothetical protein